MRFTCRTAELHARFAKATNQRRLRPTGETDMPNTIRTTCITTRTRLALLALGAISLSAAITSPASAQFVSSNASGCRSAIGIAVGRPCLTATPENNGAAQHGSNAGGAGGPSNAVLDRTVKELGLPKINPGDPVIVHKDQDGTIIRIDYPNQGYSDRTYPTGILRTYANGINQIVMTPRYSASGNGGAAGHTGARIAAPLPAGARTNATVAVTTSTTFDKATNTTTRDHRTWATAAPGGPPPAAAIGTKSTAAPQVAAQTPVVRDHRH
jgi:hypothetical protein